MRKFRAIIELDDQGYFVASIPAVPGCHTFGDTKEEAIKNIKEAFELCLEEAEENPDYKNQIDYATDRINNDFSVVEITVDANA